MVELFSLEYNGVIIYIIQKITVPCRVHKNSAARYNFPLTKVNSLHSCKYSTTSRHVLTNIVIMVVNVVTNSSIVLDDLLGI